MYNIIKTYVKTDFQWREEDVGLQTIEAIRDYQNVKITVQWKTSEQQDFFMSVNQEILHKAPKETTLKEWVSTLNKDALVTTAKARGLADCNTVDFFDLFDMASNVDTGNFTYGDGVTIPEGLDTDIRFTTDYLPNEKHYINKIMDTCLFAVNGIIYPAQKRNNDIFIINGNERLKHDSDQAISVVDFGAIGTIETVYINETNANSITRTIKDDTLKQSRFKITLDEDIGSRIPILVMDGYLHILDDLLTQVDTNALVVTVSHELAIRRAAMKPKNSRNWIDYANLESHGFNINSFNAEKYLHAVNTFVVLLDAEDFAVFKEPVGGTGITGVYHHYRVPRGMMFFDDGRLAPYYIKDYNEFECALYTIDSQKKLTMNEITNMSDKVG